MKLFYAILICFLITSCKKNNDLFITSNTITNNDISNKVGKKLSNNSNNLEECSVTDSLKMQTSEYENIKFYSENVMRGKGVIQIIINKEVKILNMNKTTYGRISLSNNGVSDSYTITLPKKIIAREIIPDSEFQIFNFDSESPETDKGFLIIYINKEKKLIKKSDTKYKFLTWDNYIKSAYIQLDGKDENLYKVLKIKNDSMQIKSISKTDCDYVENYKDITKWIKWKDNNCKLVKLNFCY